MNQDPIVRINTETCIFADNRLHVYYSVYIEANRTAFRASARYETEAREIALEQLKTLGISNFELPETQGKWKLR